MCWACLRQKPPGYQTVDAEVPMAEMYDFSTYVRQVTQGRGSFTFDFVRYEEAPQNVAQKVIEAAKANGEIELNKAMTKRDKRYDQS